MPCFWETIMAATPITPAVPTQAGIARPAEVACDAVNGNSVPNTKGLHLSLHNSGVTSRDVVFQTPGSVGGFAVADHTVAIAAGATREFADFSSAFGSTLTFTAAHAEVMYTAYSI